ncbi:MAG: LysR substrate-binding domain-containing protein [Polaromonas sp.]|uniref:LysR family transcriptional regulator n=1 Tax=Polaromonas sp. TaxID=1869339 RepID=UPI002486D358|nr:LysR family transcriptional regulator [Polaromonas sp.]MDI1271742.1 LysR substrate-binding domain-containing protein [Polaromonas sp.]
MNLTWLEDFLALASSGNFSRAASDRHMTQPAFSRRVRALEEWLGVALFDRTTHPVTLTETGQWFQSVAQDMLARVARVPDEARAVADASSATLRFASTHALSFTFLPAWLRGLESGSPMGPIQLVSDVMQQCEALMLQGRIQFLLCHWHEQVPGRLDPASHRSVKLGGDTLVPVSAPGKNGKPLHLLSSSGKYAPILAYSSESGLGRIVRALRSGALEKSRSEPVFTAHLASVLKTMALDGRGVAWLPLSLINEELASGRLVAAGGPEWAIELDIRLFRSNAAAPPAAENFWRRVAGPPGEAVSWKLFKHALTGG